MLWWNIYLFNWVIGTAMNRRKRDCEALTSSLHRIEFACSVKNTRIDCLIGFDTKMMRSLVPQLPLRTSWMDKFYPHLSCIVHLGKVSFIALVWETSWYNEENVKVKFWPTVATFLFILTVATIGENYPSQT